MATFSALSPEPGSTRGTALDTTSASFIGGSLTSSANIFQDSVNSVDLADFYKFQIGSSSSDPASVISLRLYGLGGGALDGDANLTLYNETNTLITANVTGTSPELLTYSLNPGTYYVRVRSVSGSTDYNLSLIANVIPTDNGSGNTLGTALNIGTLSNTYTTTDYVGNRGDVLDDNDYYQFNLANNGTFNLTLDDLGGNANVELLNSSGTQIAYSPQIDTNSESISKSLASGTYYVRVFPGSNASSTNYTLNLAFTADPEDLAGNTLATARDINTLSATPATFTDFVNSADTDDYYRFDLTSSALIELTLTPDTANADVRLLNSTGGVILGSSTQTGINPDTIRRSLNAGTYFIRVYPAANQATTYELSVSATPILTDIAPNSTNTANNIGTLLGSQNFSDFVGTIDTDDYYKFNLVYRSNFNLNLSGLSDNANVELLNSGGGLIQSSTLAGNTDENINTTLQVGTYFVRVRSISSAETFYNLSLSAEALIEKLEIAPGTVSSNPSNLTALGSTLYFTADDSVYGMQLWQSNGSVAGTGRITDFNPGSFNPANLTVFGTKLLFTADDGVNGRELWVYDGSSASMVRNINAAASSNPSNLTVVGSQVFFTADDGISGRELWVYNGTTVSLVKDIYSGATGSNLNNLIAFNGRLYFTANDGINGAELWTSNGTASGTTLVKNIYSGAWGSDPAKLIVVNNTLYFTANNGIDGIELWQSNGTTAGTTLVQNITPGTGGFGPSELTAVGTTLYFVTDSNNDFKQELWKIDGNGVGRVKNDLNVAPNIGFGPLNLAAVGNTLYFTTYDSSTGLELWKSDGTDTGTVLVKDIWVGPDTNNSTPASLVSFNGTLYFAASEPTNGRELWGSDGTTLGTRRISNINPATGNANPAKLTVVGTKLFFTATNGTDGTELWVL